MNILDNFVLLSDEVKSYEGIRGDAISGNVVVEESLEDEFQDKVVSMQPQKGARLQTLEKKISILEKATELNPDSKDLLLSLMNAYRSRDIIDDLISRWEKVLIQNSSSCTLWKEFLQDVQGDFSRFKVSKTRKIYANATQALSGAWTKQHRQPVPVYFSDGRVDVEHS
ncbi:hypothetical protein P3S68_003659 [Capsicum galapagoense]